MRPPPKFSKVVDCLLILEKAQARGFFAGALYSHVLVVAMATSAPQHADIEIIDSGLEKNIEHERWI